MGPVGLGRLAGSSRPEADDCGGQGRVGGGASAFALDWGSCSAKKEFGDD